MLRPYKCRKTESTLGHGQTDSLTPANSANGEAEVDAMGDMAANTGIGGDVAVNGVGRGHGVVGAPGGDTGRMAWGAGGSPVPLDNPTALAVLTVGEANAAAATTVEAAAAAAAVADPGRTWATAATSSESGPAAAAAGAGAGVEGDEAWKVRTTDDAVTNDAGAGLPADTAARLPMVDAGISGVTGAQAGATAGRGLRTEAGTCFGAL